MVNTRVKTSARGKKLQIDGKWERKVIYQDCLRADSGLAKGQTTCNKQTNQDSVDSVCAYLKSNALSISLDGCSDLKSQKQNQASSNNLRLTHYLL